MKYFKIEEFTKSATAVALGIENKPSAMEVKNIEALVENVLDPLREAFGGPISINSGYRCNALNRAVGGVISSQHLSGEAADITAGSISANRTLYAMIRQLKLPVDQAIDEKGCRWIHVSYGPRHRRKFFAIK